MLEVGTIRQTLSRLRAEGFAVSENALRQWVKNGAIPAAYSGKKAFLCYQTVVEFLTGTYVRPVASNGIDKIRRV